MSPEPQPDRLKILIADDEEDILSVLAKKLREAGHDVVPAADGIQAWDLAQREHPDLFILDLHMPGKDGFTLLKDLRDRPWDKKWRPVIIVSAQNELDSYRKGFDFDADHYLSKPCRVEEVLSAVALMARLIPLRQEG
ncbi:MAG: response regulator [Elusimicrobia bacterium]|nr:response regulator [Elusimicrobiota bacterium]